MAIFLLNYISIPIYDLLIKKKRAVLLLVTLQMFLILALRADTLGVDLVDYKIFYEHYQTMTFGEIIRGFRPIGGSAHVYGVDSGYVLFNWIIGKLGFSFHSFLVIYAGLVLSSVALFIDRYCEDVGVALATFVSIGGFVSLFGILRQSLALAIFLQHKLRPRKFADVSLIPWFSNYVNGQYVGRSLSFSECESTSESISALNSPR